MNTCNTSVIALIGISVHEVRILQTICLISKSRNQIYVIQDDVMPARADILIVDQDNPEAVATWQRFQAEYPIKPVIMLTRKPGFDLSGYQLGRPLIATRLLNMLDQILLTEERPAFVQHPKDGTAQARHADEPQTLHRSISGEEEIGVRSVALVVDDSLPVRQQIGYYLAPLVGRVDLVEDGEQAIKFIASRSYDIIFLDVVLPGMDGYKICREIKRNKRTKQIPVIMLTGKSSPFDMVKGKLAGCDTYLTKPVEATTFANVAQKYLKKIRSGEPDEECDKFSGSFPGRA